MVVSPASIPIPGLTTTNEATDAGAEEPANPSGSLPAPVRPDTAVTGFVCVSCNTHNLVRPAKESWYVVTIGRQVGVFQGMYVISTAVEEWISKIDGNFRLRHHVQPLVSGASGACYRKYPSREEALAAFQDALAQGVVACVD